MMTFAQPSARAQSVPGLKRRCMSAISAILVTRGSATIMRRGLSRRRSISHVDALCIELVVSLPHITTQLVFSMEAFFGVMALSQTRHPAIACPMEYRFSAQVTPGCKVLCGLPNKLQNRER